MRKINRPTFTVREVFGACIVNVADNALKLALEHSIDLVENAEADFDLKKRTNSLHTIQRGVAVNAIANTEQLKKVYTDRLVKKTNGGRMYYDAILFSAPRGICPLCSQRNATTLDHYLPKSEYPLLSAAPLNLIPACKDCNTGKLCNYPKNSKEETLHPYYDNVEDFEWLKSRVLQPYPFLIEYYVDPPANINQLLKDRIQYHFDCFNLNSLYTTHATEEFMNSYIQLTNLFNNGGRDSLIHFLQECYESRKISSKNSWQTAFYSGLLNNVEFCNGQFIE